MVTGQEILEEQIRMVRLRIQTDLTAYRLGHTLLSRKDGLDLIERTREEVLELFPDKGQVFDLVLLPRFLRILNERALSHWGVADSLN
jgi:hypothetical protein